MRWLPQSLAKAASQPILHGVVVRLALPALERTAVVRDDHLQPARPGRSRHTGSSGSGAASRNATASRYVCRIICAAA